jgi:N-hydroxyarylamine O-acetyltransferase
MNELNSLFRKRIGFPEDEAISFQTLGVLLEKTASAIPFENLCAIAGDETEITEGNLVEKILTRNEGGLCYDLNSIFYLFLQENGFAVQLIRGAVYVPELDGFSPTGNTHVAIILNHEGEKYIVDTGFGGNLPLKPLPLNGKEVSSSNGEFRVAREASEFGDYFLKMKLRNKHKEWQKGYAFDTTNSVADISELNGAKRIITEHPRSPFNKKPLLTRVTADGSMVLTETSFIHWQDGRMVKEEIDAERYRQLAREYFNREIR